MLTECTIVVGSIVNPLDEDHEDKVSENEEEENQLGQELKEDMCELPLADLVPKAQHHPE